MFLSAAMRTPVHLAVALPRNAPTASKPQASSTRTEWFEANAGDPPNSYAETMNVYALLNLAPQNHAA